VVLQDGTTQVNTDSIQFSFDGAVVTPMISKVGSATTITYDPPGLLSVLPPHTFRVIFSDNGVSVLTQTNEYSFSVLSYYNILLPSPIHLETFDTTAEGSLPAGWTSFGYNGQTSPNCDPGAPDVGGLQDLNSACYTNWVVVNSARFNSPMLTYPEHTPETDYQRVLLPNDANVVNGAILEDLAQGNIVFGNSGYQDSAASQIVYLFSPDLDLAGRSSVYLAFHSLWEQNQDSIGAVEYSIDEGATWLPVVYFLDGPDILRDSQGNIDAVATFGTARIGDFQGQATYVDPISMQTAGGYYGAFIAVDSNRWAELGPFISARVDDNPIESKRVEVYRLPAADNQSKVRLRFAHAGTDSWYFGLDNVGLYSITSVEPPLVTGSIPTNLTEYVGNTVGFSVTLKGIGPFTLQWQRNGVALANQTNSTITLNNVQLSDSGDYAIVVGYPGGSVTNGTARLTVVHAPAYVIGQWDFDNSDLTASCGHDLEFFDSAVEINTGFSSSEFFGLPPLNEMTVNVMQFSGQIPGSATGGYKMRHGLPGNGGGTNVNQYTLIMDIIYPATSDSQWRSLLQTDPNNSDDADFFVSNGNGLGINSVYHGTIQPDTWHRIALTVDLAGPGPNPIVAKYIDGVKVGQQQLPAGRDGRWSLLAVPSTPYALLFADNDVDVQVGYVSSIQLRGGRLSDAEIAALGSATAKKIPGCISARMESGELVVRWTGGVPLQSADNVTGPWSDVVGAESPHAMSGPLGERKFFRPRP
jgi:hypothetical protein